MPVSQQRINLAGYYRLHIPALFLPVAAAGIIDGWPALASIGAVLLSALAALDPMSASGVKS